MGASGWDNFWKDQKRSFYAVMKISTGYFTRQIVQKGYVRSGDAVLDFGCGPGFVADDLANKGIHYTGLDINEFFIAACRKNHPWFNFYHITTDTAANKTILKNELGLITEFNRIILLSVVQYLNSTDDLNRIIQLLLSYLEKDGQILIADVIDSTTSSARDAWALFKYCLQKGKLGAFTGFMAYLLFSDYRQLSKKMQLLQISEQAMQAIAANNGLQCRQVPGLTVHPTRKNYVFYRPNR
jgi:2-polyprenyl-3-methyl-5-hydroxy-6-metoxy-1,4-benzoquinol methylase